VEYSTKPWTLVIVKSAQRNHRHGHGVDAIGVIVGEITE